MSDPSTIGQRFTQLIQELGLTKNAFAQSLGKTATVIQHLVDERNKPGFDLLRKVFEVYPTVSKDWLMEGKGPIMRTGSQAELLTKTPELEAIDLASLATPARRTNSLLQPADIAATLTLAARNGNGSHPGHRSVPVSDAPAQTAAPTRPPVPAPVPTVSSAPEAPAPTSPAGPVVAPAPVALPDPTYLAALLQAQHLQHQLALAEQRNQHLLEQQALLRQLVQLLQKT